MSKGIKCPKCGKHEKITLFNPENLAGYYNATSAAEDGYFLEKEAYSTAKCWDCGYEFKMDGKITWNLEEVALSKPKMETFSDYDHIECVELSKAKIEYPELNWDKIEERFVYGMGKDEYMDVLTLADLNLCVRLHADKLEIEDINYEEVAWCSVCHMVLLPQDECYTDHHTGDPLCDGHSRFSETFDNYVKYIF